MSNTKKHTNMKESIDALTRNLENRFFTHEGFYEAVSRITELLRERDCDDLTPDTLSVVQYSLDTIIETSKLPGIQDSKEVTKICSSIMNHFILLADASQIIYEVVSSGNPFAINELMLSQRS